MKFRVLIPFMSLISLLILMGAGVGCDSTSSSVSMSMARDIPGDVDQFVFIDVETLRDDENLQDAYESMEDEFGDMLDDYGIDFDDIDSMATYSDSALLYGNFDLEDIRDELNFLDYGDDVYKNVEVWKSDDLSDNCVALIGEGTVICGSAESVRDCIKVIEEGEYSLSDDQSYKDIMDRLPAGIMIRYNTDGDYTNQQAQGTSLQRKDDDTLKMTAVFRFKDEVAAEDAINELEGDIEEGDNIKNIDVEQDKEFIIVTAEIDISDAFGEGTQGSTQALEVELRDVQTAVIALIASSDSGTLDAECIGLTTNDISDFTADGGALNAALYMTGLNDDNTTKTGRYYTIDIDGKVTQSEHNSLFE